MILIEAKSIARADAARFAWGDLRRFHHVPFVAERMIELHEVPQDQRHNVQKQATQLRQCLLQAREYREAAAVTTLATRPLLLYYSIMSLALAEILFKGDDRVSLDKARDEHRHHGLQFTARNRGKDVHALADCARSLIAVPMTGPQGPKGTFALWHRVARHTPLVGTLNVVNILGSTKFPGILAQADDEPITGFPEAGMSLWDCLQGTPGMYDWLLIHDLPSQILRARVDRQIDLNHTPAQSSITFTMHPQAVPERVREVKAKIRLSTNHPMKLEEYRGGFKASWRDQEDNQVKGKLPEGAMWTADEVRLLAANAPLNEFGYLYVGLFILGNYARYYPDRWMVDVEAASPLAVAAEEFLAMAEWRMALLILSELARTYYVVGAV